MTERATAVLKPGCSYAHAWCMRGPPIRQPETMESSADVKHDAPPTPVPAARNQETDPEPGRHREPIEEHQFQRPIVSPVGPGVRPAPRGG